MRLLAAALTLSAGTVACSEDTALFEVKTCECSAEEVCRLGECIQPDPSLVYLDVSPVELTLTAVNQTLPLTITNVGQPAATLSRVGLSDPLGLFACDRCSSAEMAEPINLEQGETYELQIQLRQATAGAGTLSIFSNDAEFSSSPIKVELFALRQEYPLEAPDRLDFGFVSAGTSTRATIRIRGNLGERVVLSVSGSSAFSVGSAEATLEGGLADVEVSFNPLSQEAHEALLDIQGEGRGQSIRLLGNSAVTPCSLNEGRPIELGAVPQNAPGRTTVFVFNPSDRTVTYRLSVEEEAGRATGFGFDRAGVTVPANSVRAVQLTFEATSLERELVRILATPEVPVPGVVGCQTSAGAEGAPGLARLRAELTYLAARTEEDVRTVQLFGEDPNSPLVVSSAEPVVPGLGEFTGRASDKQTIYIEDPNSIILVADYINDCAEADLAQWGNLFASLAGTAISIIDQALSQGQSQGGAGDDVSDALTELIDNFCDQYEGVTVRLRLQRGFEELDELTFTLEEFSQQRRIERRSFRINSDLELVGLAQ